MHLPNMQTICVYSPTLVCSKTHTSNQIKLIYYICNMKYFFYMPFMLNKARICLSTYFKALRPPNNESGSDTSWLESSLSFLLGGGKTESGLHWSKPTYKSNARNKHTKSHTYISRHSLHLRHACESLGRHRLDTHAEKL